MPELHLIKRLASSFSGLTARSDAIAIAAGLSASVVRGRTVSWAAAIGLVVASAVPSSAAAKHGQFVIEASRTMEAHARGSKGFGISLFGSGRNVDLTARGHNASVSYDVRGRSSGRQLKGRFGQLGRVSLYFHPRQKAHFVPEPAGNCTGGGKFVEPGAFVGTLEFEGERSYTKIKAGRVRGTITRNLKEICKESGGGGEGGPPARWTLLRAGSKDGRVSFDAFRIESKARPALDASIFSASLVDLRPHGMSVFRSIQSDGNADTFEVTRAHGVVVSAVVDPPAPFSGGATYQRQVQAPSESWTGSLTGDFPGVGAVTLAGPEFCAESELLASCGGSSQFVFVGTGS